MNEKMNRNGQIKIQQMAFVLVALMIFFGFASLIYFTFVLSDVTSGAETLKEREAKEIVQKISLSPELSFTGFDCVNCIDLDKALILSERKQYEGFWNLNSLKIEKIYPSSEIEREITCSRGNYPKCNIIEIISGDRNSGGNREFWAYVPLCRWEQYESDNGYFKCEIGRVLASGDGIGGANGN